MTVDIHNLKQAFGHLAVETSRSTCRDPEPPTTTGRQGRNLANSDADSPALQAGAGPRIGRRRLAHIFDRLTDRDVAVLVFLGSYRFATTGQLARLHAPAFNGSNSALRQTNRQLTKFQGDGLVRSLERRVGGVRAGSSSSIWTLTTAGRKLAHQQNADREAVSRARFVEPSISFLDHTLAVTEVAVRLAELTHTDQLASMQATPEPACWRRYLGRAGQPVWLKPDLSAITVTPDDFEDHWFIEVDRATENPARIISKCRQYLDYRATGREQADVGLFPAVLWVTPDARRRDQLAERLADEPDIVHGLFHIITIDDIQGTIQTGPEPAESTTDKPRKEGQPS